MIANDLVRLMNSAALSITTGSNDAPRLPSNSAVRSDEAVSLDKIAGKDPGHGGGA
jgi:hypothetical protein